MQNSKMEHAEVQKITKDSTIGQIVDNYPETIETLMSFGVHCVGCHVSPFETLEMGFRGHGMGDTEINEAIERLNMVIQKSHKTKKLQIHENINFDDMKLTLTEKAAAKIKEILQQEKKEALRVSVMPGGCSGFQYGLELDDNSTSNDLIIEDKGVKLFIDKTSILKLKGSNIDYIDSLQGAGFKINNPNAASSCGCGSSFG